MLRGSAKGRPCYYRSGHQIGTDATFKSLRDLLNHHNSTMKDILKWGTLKNFGATEKYLLEYLSKDHKTNNIFLKSISYQFVTGYEKFLRRQKGKNGKKQLSNNEIMKHMERFKKLTNLAIKLGWLEKDPFRDYKMKFQKFDRAYLNQIELDFIENTRFTRTTLETTKDIFLFACYTCLSYVDVKNLTRENITSGVNGKEWIYCCCIFIIFNNHRLGNICFFSITNFFSVLVY